MSEDWLLLDYARTDADAELRTPRPGSEPATVTVPTVHVTAVVRLVEYQRKEIARLRGKAYWAGKRGKRR